MLHLGCFCVQPSVSPWTVNPSLSLPSTADLCLESGRANANTEKKRAEFKGEVSQYREQRCFHFYWNHLSLQFGWGWCSHLPHWVLRMKSATSESSCFCYTPVKTEAPRSCHSSGAPCYVSSFRTHHEAHVELCQEAPRTSSREEDGRRPWLTAQVRSYTEALKFKPAYLMKDVSKQESKQEALDDYCLV